LIAAYGWAANLLEDVTYPYMDVDSNGKKMSEINKFVLHFAKGQMPPVNAFWSITMYDPKYFFVANPLNQFTLSPRHSLIYNADDSSLNLFSTHRLP
jgi:hypothetical protein